MKRLKNGWEISDHSIFFEKKRQNQKRFCLFIYASVRDLSVIPTLKTDHPISFTLKLSYRISKACHFKIINACSMVQMDTNRQRILCCACKYKSSSLS